MAGVFLEILFETGSLESAGFYGRDEVEDPLHEVLEEAGIGEVTGGGGGIYGSNVDVEIPRGRDFKAALAIIRKTLIDLNAPADTKIIRHKPIRREYKLTE